MGLPQVGVQGVAMIKGETVSRLAMAALFACVIVLSVWLWIGVFRALWNASAG